jgi:hypothetical protein
MLLYVFSIVHRSLPLVEMTNIVMGHKRRRHCGVYYKMTDRHLDQRERPM